MKILLVNDYAAPIGGAEILMLDFRQALRERGHDARLFASNAGENGTCDLADYTCRGTTSRFRTLLQSANPWAALELRRVLHDFQPDVVHVKMFLTQLSPLILPLLRDVPCLYHAVWYRSICPLGTKVLPARSLCYSPPGVVCYQGGCLPLHDWLPLMLQMKLWRRWRYVFDLIVANSEPVKRRLLAEGIEAVEVVPNGISSRQPRPPLSEKPTVAFAGRLVREKGVDVLLCAFAKIVQQIPEARLIVCGQGPENAKIEKLTGELGLADSVSIAGFLPHDEVEQIFRKAWVVAIPSVWEEPFGHVAIEAMINGVAVVASDSGGLSTMVQNGRTGFLVQPSDANALAAALLQLLCDRELAERMGEAGRKRAIAEFSRSALVDRFVELYRSICRK